MYYDLWFREVGMAVPTDSITIIWKHKRCSQQSSLLVFGVYTSYLRNGNAQVIWRPLPTPSKSLLTQTDAITAGREQISVNALKHPHSDASRIESINTFCRSTEPYTLSRSFLMPPLSSCSQATGDFVTAVFNSDPCICETVSRSFSAVLVLLLLIHVIASCSIYCMYAVVAVGPRPSNVKVGVVTS